MRVCRRTIGSDTISKGSTPSKSMLPFIHGRRLRACRPGNVRRERKKFVTVKVSEHITHIKKFKGTKTLVKDFGMIADILGDRMGCFLFQLPPSYRFTKTGLNDIVSQLDPGRRHVVEFRHASWWNGGGL